MDISYIPIISTVTEYVIEELVALHALNTLVNTGVDIKINQVEVEKILEEKNPILKKLYQLERLGHLERLHDTFTVDGRVEFNWNFTPTD